MVSRSFNGQDNSRTGTALRNQRRERLSWFFMRVYNRTIGTKISSTKSHFPAVESSFYLRQEVLLDGQLTKSGLKQRGIREPYRIAGIKAPDTCSEGAISIFADQGKVKETGFLSICIGQHHCRRTHLYRFCQSKKKAQKTNRLEYVEVKKLPNLSEVGFPVLQTQLP